MSSSARRIIPAVNRTRSLAIWAEYLERYEPGKELVVTVEEFVPKRNAEQNDRMWAMLADLSRQVDWQVNGALVKLPPEDWKIILSASLKREQRIAQGVDGGFVMLGERTSKMSKRQMSELIELIQFFGDSRQVIWSDPRRADQSYDDLMARRAERWTSD